MTFSMPKKQNECSFGGLQTSLSRGAMLARLAVSMVVHARLKTIGSLAGIVFSMLLAGQQLGALVGVTHQAALYQEKAKADLWIIPHGVTLLGEGTPLPDSIGMRARSLPEVASAEPVILGATEIRNPDGQRQSVTVLGRRREAQGLGPWNVVSGQVSDLSLPGAITVEDTLRERTGSTNLGSMRELGGREVRVVATTWGMISWFPQFAWMEPELARDILGITPGFSNFFVVRLTAGADAQKVAVSLATMVPEAEVLTSAQYISRIETYVVVDAGAGAILFTSAIIGLFVGFVIVSLMMYNSVNDSIREFGALKAIGAANGDLAFVVMVQAVVLGLAGSLLGGTLLAWMPALMRSPNVIILIDLGMIAILAALMVVICVLASIISVARLRKIEPGMVFR